MARALARERIARSAKEREVLEMLQWKPRLRVLLAVLALLVFAFALGWIECTNFLEW